MNYRAYGIALSSEIPLPELQVAAADPPSISVRVSPGRPADIGWHWTRPKPEDDAPPWLAIAQGRGCQRLLFDGGADFVVREDLPVVTVFGAPECPADAIRHRLIDQVIPLVLAHHFDKVVLHASGVRLQAIAVAFLGAAGAGKSTLSASFGIRGAAVLSDDAIVVEREGKQLMATPGYAGIRIGQGVLAALRERREPEEGRKALPKARHGADEGLRFSDASVPLRRMYVLAPEREADPISIERLAPRETIMALVEHAFILDIADRRRLVERFERLTDLAAVADVRRLRYPRRFSSLDPVCEAVLQDLSAI